MLNRSGETGYFCLVLDLQVNAFSLIEYDVYSGIFIWPLFEVVSFYSQLLRVFIMKGHDIVSNAFSASVDTTFFFLHFVNVICITFIDLSMLKHLCIPAINLTWP